MKKEGRCREKTTMAGDVEEEKKLGDVKGRKM